MAFKIKFYKKYFIDFYINQEKSVQEKIDYVFKIINTVNRIPIKFLKHIEGTEGLFEIRIRSGNNIFRIFCCFDYDKIIILFNVFQKKSRKTPKKEIKKAMELKREYFDNKNGGVE